MTPSTAIQQPSGVTAQPSPPPIAGPRPAAQPNFWDRTIRIVLTIALIVGYFQFHGQFTTWLQESVLSRFGEVHAKTIDSGLVAVLLLTVVVIWRKTLARDKRYYAPLLISSILIMGDAAFGILESHASPLLARMTGGLLTRYSPTFVVIFTTILAEMFLGRFFYGKWPHLASAYVSGISAGILIKSPLLWPFVMCGLISITSKYVLRVGDRHLWNPTNFGVTMMLFLAPEQVASLTVQAGNEIWAPFVIWILGGLILYQLGRLHQPVAFVLAFVPLSILRAWWTGHPILTELTPITSPMFQLYIFFMITDPRTTTKSKWSQTVVVVLVAVAETFFRLVFRDQHSLYHALFTVGPISNLIEIVYLARMQRATAGPEVPPAVS